MGKKLKRIRYQRRGKDRPRFRSNGHKQRPRFRSATNSDKPDDRPRTIADFAKKTTCRIPRPNCTCAFGVIENNSPRNPDALCQVANDKPQTKYTLF